MDLIYKNFDGLDITYQGAIPEPLLNQLEEARNQAQESKKEVYLELGPQKLQCLVKETGARGGYRYCFDTGQTGETWFIAKSNRLDGYNIRVSVHSLSLAIYGYEGLKLRLQETLAKLQAVGVAGATPLESISRVDYCFDFLSTTPFNPSPEQFIAHQRCQKRTIGETGIPLTSVSQGDQISTIMVGKMPGRQATLYNKSKEIQGHNKPYWRDLWKLDQYPAGTVWRVEVRAGKDELGKWNLKRFADFEAKIGDVIISILEAIRYTTSSADSNRARWPNDPFWQEAINQAKDVLAPYICHANREKILDDYRLNVMKRYRESILGNMVGYAAACQRDVAELPMVIETLGYEMTGMVLGDPEHYQAKFNLAEQRMRMLK